MWNFEFIKIVRINQKKRWTDQVVKVHPLKEGWVKILQVLIHCLTLDLLRKQTISCFSFEVSPPGAVAPHFDFGRSPFPLPSEVETQDREIHETGKKHVLVKTEITMKICFGDWRIEYMFWWNNEDDENKKTSSRPLGAGVRVDFFCLQSSSISAYLMFYLWYRVLCSVPDIGFLFKNFASALVCLLKSIAVVDFG